jgi:PAS domain S-box-containing protein
LPTMADVRNEVRSSGLKKYCAAALLVALAASIGVSFKPMLTSFPALTPILFLGAIAFVARYIDFAASILALCLSSALLQVYFFPSASPQSLPGLALVKTIFFTMVSACVCALIRKLRNARVSRSRLAAIVESSSDAIISEDLSGTVTSWNRAATKMFGYEPEEMIGQPILWIIPEELHEQEEAILRRLGEGKRIDHFETERLRKDGSRIKVSLTISPLIDAEGRMEGRSKIVRDITERVRLQEAFIESEKLAATGRMAAAIAHEINNPLEAMTNLAYLLNTNEHLDSSARDTARMLMDEISRISNVAKRSLRFFRDTDKPSLFDVTETMDGVLDLNLALLAQKSIEVERDYTGPCIAFGSSAEMRQVFSNLIRNAIDAVGTEGRIRVRMRLTRSGDCRISVADNGHGILPDAKQRLFEPFITTKGTTGNGLGLWISRGIVEKHGGQIRGRSASLPGGSWTVFSVVLPGDRRAAREEAEVAVVGGRRAGDSAPKL